MYENKSNKINYFLLFMIKVYHFLATAAIIHLPVHYNFLDINIIFKRKFQSPPEQD